jgi:uncharacterized membrane protein YcaP (DUF421 family)
MDLVLRAVVVFFFIYLITRVIGRRELSSLEPFDLILLVVIGDLVQQGVTQADESVTGTLTVLATFSVLTVAVGYVSFMVKRVRTVLEGSPIVLVRDGDVLEDNLKRERLTVAEVEAEARLQQVASIADIRWAVLETGGQISVIPKRSAS